MSKDAIGSVGEEAAKLFAVLQQASADARHGTGAQSNGYDAFAEAFPEEQAQQSCECQWCPVCQLISRAKKTSPETIEHLATAAAGVLGSVRSLLEAAAEAARQARTDADAGPAHDEEEETRPKADRIDVSEDPEPWD